MIDPGELRCPIIITSESTALTASGEQQKLFTVICNTWSKITPLTSKEMYALGSGFTEEVSHKVLIRYRTDVKRGMQIAYRGATYKIQLVQDPTMMREELNLICLENQ